MVAHIIHKIPKSLIVCETIWEIYQSVNMYTTTLPYGEMIKIKVIDLDELCNFYVRDFFI